MTRDLSTARALHLRLRAQRLTPQRRGGADEVVAEVCGLQAQDAGSAVLGVRARSAGLTAAGIERARVEQRTIVRTWAMRGTLHLVAAADLGWLLPLLGPIFVAAGRRRRLELGLDDDTCARGLRAIRAILGAHGPLTRAGLAARLASRGIPTGGQAAIHLIACAALSGLVCLGPDRGRAPTYVVLDDWVTPGRPLTDAAAWAELARRHLRAYGPAGPDDLAAWAGVPAGRARAAWRLVADELLEVRIAGQPAWILRTRARWLDGAPPRGPLVRLLPGFDTYLLGYRGRGLAVAPGHARRVHPGGGMLRPTLIVDGRAAGTWRTARRRGRTDVLVEPFQPLPRDVRRGLDAEAADLGRFLGVHAVLRLAAPS